MRVLIAPDSFKESLSAAAAAEAIAAGFATVWPEAQLVRQGIADGGEGTLAVLIAQGADHQSTRVSGPLGDAVDAEWAMRGDLACIELAQAAGLMLAPPAQRDPTTTTTHGVGELMATGVAAGARRLLVALGGSATCDGGAGLLQALGARLLDAAGQPLPAGGGALAQLAGIDLQPVLARLAGIELIIASDVDNPLAGPNGAARVFAAQKGATAQQVDQLDAALAHYGKLLTQACGRNVTDLPGAGAAGGTAAALLALGATLQSGAEWVLDAVGIDTLIADCDLVITGEGRMDGQTLGGKAPLALARRAQRLRKPVIGLAGSLADDADALLDAGFTALFAATRAPCNTTEALARAAPRLTAAARNLAALLKLGLLLR